MHLLKNFFLLLCSHLSILFSRCYRKLGVSNIEPLYVFVDSFSAPVDAGRRTTDEMAEIIGRSYPVEKIDVSSGIQRVYCQIKKLNIHSNTIVYVRSPGYMVRLMLVELLLWTKLNIVYYTGDVYHLRLRSEAEFSGGSLTTTIKYFLYRYLEIFIWRYATCVLSPCLSEAEYVKEINENSFILPIRFFSITDLKNMKIQSASKDLVVVNFIFVGGYSHPPNRGAVFEIVENLMPKLTDEIPNCKCYIIGKGWDIDNYSSRHNVVFTGMVSDKELEGYLRNSHFMLSPLPFGAGVKGKVIEAMSHGIIVVTNYYGWQGINADFVEPLQSIEAQLDFIRSFVSDTEKFEAYKNAYVDFLVENYSDHVPVELHKNLMQTIISDKL